MSEKLMPHDKRMEYWNKAGFTPRTALDIGACIGQWTKSVKRVWPNCVVTQVEADPRCEQILRPQGYELYMVPLADTIKEVPFYATDNDDLTALGNSSIYLEQTGVYSRIGYKETLVKTETIDNLFKDRIFDFVKLDTQGSEMDILRGGKNVFARTHFVQLELSFVDYNKGAPQFAECVSIMKNEFNYTALDVFQVHYLGIGDSATCVQIDLLFGRTL